MVAGAARLDSALNPHPFERSCEITKTRKCPQKLFSIRGRTGDYSDRGIDFVSPPKPAKTLANRFLHSFNERARQPENPLGH